MLSFFSLVLFCTATVVQSSSLPEDHHEGLNLLAIPIHQDNEGIQKYNDLTGCSDVSDKASNQALEEAMLLADGIRDPVELRPAEGLTYAGVYFGGRWVR